MNFDVALETFDSLDFESQNVFVEILNNRLREKRRDNILQSYNQAIEDVNSLKIKPETPDDFFKRIDYDLKGKS
jgi:hypothetical protein